MVLKPTYEELEQQIGDLERENNAILKAKQEIEDSEKLHLITLENISDTVLITDDHGKILYVCPNTSKIFRLSPSEVYNLGTIHKLINGTACDIAELRRKNEITNIEWTIKDKSGHERFLLINVKSVDIKGGTALYVMHDITERKRAEEAFKVNLIKYQTLFESLPIGVTISDKAGNILESNKEAERLLKLSREEHVKRNIAGREWSIIRPDGSPMPAHEYASVRALKENHLVKNVEMGIVKGEGDVTWINVTAIPIPLEHYGVVIIYSDIAERKRAEESLRESQEKLKDFINSATDSFVFFDSELNIIQVNKAHMEMFHPGMDQKDLIGKNLLKIVPEMKETGRFDDFMKVMETGTPFYSDDIVPPQKFGNRNLSVKAFKMAGGLGTITVDVTSRKQAEVALISEKLVSEKYINSLPGLFYVFDEQRFVRWNSIWNRITGYSDEEMASMYGTDFFEGKDKMLIEEQMLRVFREGTAEAEAELVTKSGRRIPYYFTGLRKKLNGKDHLIGLGIDITDRKLAEEEKRKALEFTAEQSKHALIGQVAGKMAHDFNNVLMGIMGNAQLAVLDCDDEKIKKKLEWIIDFSERGRDITSNLMSYSKDQEPKQTYFKIEDKIELVLKMLEKDLTGIKVSRNYKTGIPKLLADPGMIQDVLVNLVQNSIHAMSKVGNPALNLKAYSQDDRVYFEIKDNGCGIPKEHHDSIYTPSFTLKGGHDKTGSYRSGIKGSGYGMSNVKKYIVEKHKGDIFLKSEVGKGTKITIVLRAIKNYLSSDEKKEVMKSQTYDKRKILLVEDESAIADVQYQILTKEPFNHIVSTAVNGQMAIDIFDRNEFDVISLDYMLPGNINGLDVYNHIRENDKDIPVMFISGNIEFLESMKKLREKDPNLDHLSKPVDNLEYVNKINELVGRSIKKNVPSTVFSQYLK